MLYYRRMITKEDIQNLAELSRIDLQENELEGVRSKLEGVLGYVSEVQKLAKESADEAQELPLHHNAFREDAVPHETGLYTEAILKNAPSSEGGYVKVKKIL